MMPIIDVKATGEKIRELREKSGYSVRDLAEIMGMNAQAVYHWQHGRSLPTVDNLVYLSEILKTPMSQIIIVEERHDF